MSAKSEDELARAQELFDFLQGRLPEGTLVVKKDRPKLTPAQAWTVIWYLGNAYWQVPDYIERCDICGDLYHTHSDGSTLDYGKAPYSFCSNCMESDEYHKKNRRNPDKNAREDSNA